LFTYVEIADVSFFHLFRRDVFSVLDLFSPNCSQREKTTFVFSFSILFSPIVYLLSPYWICFLPIGHFDIMPTVWETAKAKLTEEIKEGRLPAELSAAEVWRLEPEYARVPIDNFKQNLAALRERFVKFKLAADSDDAALRHDRLLFPIKIEGLWPGSEAERLLKKDIDDDLYPTMTPKELYNLPGREAYKAFEYDKFRKHIHQEIRSRRDSLYWVALKENSAAAKEKAKERRETKRAKEDELMRAGYGGTTVAHLKAECGRRGLNKSGKKAELIERLRLDSNKE
jgi:SAP domain